MGLLLLVIQKICINYQNFKIHLRKKMIIKYIQNQMKLEIKINQKMKVYNQPSKIKKDKN